MPDARPSPTAHGLYLLPLVDVKRIVIAAVMLLILSCASTERERARREIVAQYNKIAEANARKDLDAELAIRAPDFSARFPDGRVASAEEMAGYSRALFAQMQPPVVVRNTIRAFDYRGDTAVATVWQEFSRMQTKAGALRHVETTAQQRETWVRTSEGWKLRHVADVKPGAWYVDGKRVDPSKPYDPDAVPFDPGDGLPALKQ
jgi:hypothetical protein